MMNSYSNPLLVCSTDGRVVKALDSKSNGLCPLWALPVQVQILLSAIVFTYFYFDPCVHCMMEQLFESFTCV